MYSCTVGSDFKIGFFKRSLNFCYDKQEGIIYSSNLTTLSKLGIKKDKIDVAFDEKQSIPLKTEVINSEIVKAICNEMIEKNNENINQQFEENEQTTNEKIDNLRKEKVLLELTIKELVEVYQELIEIDEDQDKTNSQTFTTLKSSIGLLNKKIKESKETVDGMKLRFESTLQMLAKSNNLPNVFANGITVEKIWSSIDDKNTAATLSIMLMIKKYLEQKGNRV
jgi:ribosomal protein S17E